MLTFPASASASALELAPVMSAFTWVAIKVTVAAILISMAQPVSSTCTPVGVLAHWSLFSCTPLLAIYKSQ